MPLRKPVFTAQTLHQQLRDEIYRRIRNHELRPGDQLPSEIALAEEFGVSVGTVRKVLDELVSSRIVERRKGRGTFVSGRDQAAVELRFYRLRSPNNRIPAPGPATITCRKPTGHEMSMLKIDAGMEVFHMVRVRHIDGVPVNLEALSVPVAYVPGIGSLTELPQFFVSYYYDMHGVIIQRGEETIRAIAADDALSIKLETELGAPIMLLERVLFDSTGRPFELRVRHCTAAAGIYQAEIA